MHDVEGALMLGCFHLANIFKGSTINDLGGAEENSKKNLYFPGEGLSRLSEEGPPNFFF